MSAPARAPWALLREAPSGGRRLRVALLVATAAAAGAVLASILAGAEERPSRTAAGRSGATATVERRTLVERETVDGTLGYFGRRTVLNRLGSPSRAGGGGRGSRGASGSVTLTALAREGSVVRRGGVLYRADGEPVVLMYGATPAYRRLASDVEDGADVRQLERNLAALGFSPGAVDRSFTADTAAAVRRWQRTLGLDETGAVEIGRVVFAPGRRRVGAHKASKGSVLGAGSEVLELTSSRRTVTVDLDADKQALVSRGDRVTVTLPDGRVTHGRVVSVGSVAREKDESGGGESPGGGGDEGDDADKELVVDMRVSIGSPRGSSRLDQAPVSVGIASETRRRVLSVPVGALLARRGGGYTVEVVGRGRRRLLPVRPGLFADGLVEVAGKRLREGMRVGVAE